MLVTYQSYHILYFCHLYQSLFLHQLNNSVITEDLKIGDFINYCKKQAVAALSNRGYIDYNVLYDATSWIECLTEFIVTRDDDKSSRRKVLQDVVGEYPEDWAGVITKLQVMADDMEGGCINVEYPDGEVIEEIELDIGRI